MEKTEICFICKLSIRIKVDKYVEITDFDGEIKVNSIYAHTNCWMAHMSNKGLMREALETQGRVLEALGVANV